MCFICLSTASERPHIQNDTITINHRFATDHIIKLSISHALSQVRPLHCQWYTTRQMSDRSQAVVCRCCLMQMSQQKQPRVS